MSLRAGRVGLVPGVEEEEDDDEEDGVDGFLPSGLFALAGFLGAAVQSLAM